MVRILCRPRIHDFLIRKNTNIICIVLYFVLKYIHKIQYTKIQKGSKMAITTQDIHKAADQLQAQGIKPTQTNVREHLGGGSFTTINEALRTWRAEQDETAQLQEVILPNNLAESSHALIAKVWETAQELANERLVKEREALAHKESLINAELDESQEVVKTLEKDIAELTEQLDKINNELSAEREQNEQLSEQNKSLTQTEQHLQTRLQSEKERADQANDQTNKLQSKLDEQHARIEQLTAQLATANAQATTAQAQADHHAQRADKATAELTNANTENARLQGKNETLTEQLTKAETTTANQVEKINQLTAQVVQLEQVQRENTELKRMIENAKAEQEKAKPRTKKQPDMLETGEK